MGLVGKNVAVLLGGAALSLLAGMSVSLAQDTDATAAQTEEAAAGTGKKGRVTALTRIVLGAGQDKVAIATPQSVTVSEQEDIDLEQAATVGEVLRAIPGVNTAGSERVTGQGFNIRGIGAPESSGEEGRIIVNVDGAVKFYEQYRMGGLFTDPELYKRVEVLRGPASSTLYGSGALGGVINFTTKDASDFIEEGGTGAFKLKGSYNSNRNGWLGAAVLAHRFSEDFDILIAGNYRKADSYITGNGTVIRSSDFAAWSGLAKVTGNVGDEGKVKLSYQHWDSDAQDQDYAQIGGAVSGGSVNGFGTVDRHVTDKTAVASYENPFSDNDWFDVKLSASYSDTTVTQRNATGAPGFTCAVPGGDTFCDVNYGYRTFQAKAENTSEWHGESWENFLTYGVQLAHQTRSAESFNVMKMPIYSTTHPEGTDLKTALYVQDEFIWDERLTIIPGIRLEWRTLTPDSSTTLTAPKNDFAFSPKIAGHFKLNENFAVFGSVAHTERLPTLDEVYSRPKPSFGLQTEKSDNYEAGFAVSAFDLAQAGDSLQLKTTGFYNNISNLIFRQCQSTATCAPFATQYINLNKARIYGAEVELAYDSDYVFANASYSHVIGKNAVTNAFLTSVAPHEFGFTLGGKLPEHGVRFGWTGRIVAAPQDPALNRVSAPPSGSTRFAQAFNVHDIFINWKPEDGALKGWEGTFGIDNIFNTQYKEFLHNDAAKGRTFKVTLAKQFNY